MGAAWLGSSGLAAKRRFLASLGMTPYARLAALPGLPRKFAANETATIGKTGIQTSLLAMGTGTVGSGHHSHQTALGIKGLSDLLLNGYEHGLRFFDAADSYGSHPHVAEALKHVPRERLFPCTNCGMVPLPREVAAGKLEALGAGAALVRAELV